MSFGVLPVEPVVLWALTTTPPIVVLIVEPAVSDVPVDGLVAEVDVPGVVSAAAEVVDADPVGEAAALASVPAAVAASEPPVEVEVDALEVDALDVEVPVDVSSAAAMP